MEGTLTLADALLDDLDDLSDYEEEKDEEEKQQGGSGDDQDRKPPAVNRNTNGEESSFTSPGVSTGSGQDLLGKRFLDDAGLLKLLKAIETSQSSKKSASSTTEGDESAARHNSNPQEYQMIVQSNKNLHQLQEEMLQAHHALTMAYEPHFPELQELLPNNALAYKNAVAVIMRNEIMDLSKIHSYETQLQPFLSSNQIITLVVAASTTSGRLLTDLELHQVDAILQYMDQILVVQETLSTFVEERMHHLAPCISALIGTSLAARLVGLAGGLAELCRIPACNLQVLGQVKASAASRAGFASTTATNNHHNHAGVLMECDLVQRCPRHLQSKMLKTVASKLALAARCDFSNLQQNQGAVAVSATAAASGIAFRAQVEAKLQQWQEPDRAPVLKALPKPDLTVKKRRGGRKMRQLKERFEETALMKQANTRAFSAQTGEYGDDAMGLTMGLLDTAQGDGNGGGSGNVRKQVAEKRKMRQTNTKATRKRAQMARTASASNNNGASAMISGLASTISFTPMRAMELVNPDAQKDRVRQANLKWFSDSAGFQSAVPPKK